MINALYWKSDLCMGINALPAQYHKELSERARRLIKQAIESERDRVLRSANKLVTEIHNGGKVDE